MSKVKELEAFKGAIKGNKRKKKDIVGILQLKNIGRK